VYILYNILAALRQMNMNIKRKCDTSTFIRHVGGIVSGCRYAWRCKVCLQPLKTLPMNVHSVVMQ